MNDIFKYTWRVFSNNILYIIRLSFPLLLIDILWNVLSKQVNEPTTSFIFSTVAIQFLLYSTYLCALILFISQEFLGEIQPIQTNIIKSFVYLPLVILTLSVCYSPLILLGILLLKTNSSVIVTLPLLALGIYASLKTTFSPFLLILEGDKPISAVINSFKYTKGLLGEIFTLILVLWLPTSLIQNISNINTSIQPLNITLNVAGGVLTVGMFVMLQIAFFKLYVNSCHKRNNISN